MTDSSSPVETPVAFSARGLKPTLLEALKKKEYMTPMPIQEQTRNKFLTGRDVVGQSQTGSGKTAAYLLPLLQNIDPKIAIPQVLILAPTRELALQIEEECFELTRGLFGVKGVLVCGGMSYRNQIVRLQRGANIVIGTPGRIMDMLSKNIIKTRDLRYFVLDEVDRMLDMGFADEVEDIRSGLPQNMQVMCFSATMPPELTYMLDKHLGDGYETIKIHKEIFVDKLDHAFMRVEESEKLEHLEQYLIQRSFAKILVFAQTKRNVSILEKALRVSGYETVALHGDIDQYERIKTMKAFKSSHKVILVATDVASRGLNLNNVDLVVNYDMPQDPEDYIHRVGRTARAGQSGEAIMFVTPQETGKMRRLERTNRIQMRQIDRDGKEVARRSEPSHGGSTGGGGYRNRFSHANKKYVPQGGRYARSGQSTGGSYQKSGERSSSYARPSQSTGGSYQKSGERSSSYARPNQSTGSSYQRSGERSSSYASSSSSSGSSYRGRTGDAQSASKGPFNSYKKPYDKARRPARPSSGSASSYKQR